MQDPGGPCLNFLGPVTATQWQTVRQPALFWSVLQISITGNSGSFPLASEQFGVVFRARNVVTLVEVFFSRNTQESVAYIINSFKGCSADELHGWVMSFAFV